MSIEDELVRRMNRRRFLLGAGSVLGGTVLARAALNAMRNRDLARQQPGVEAGTGPGHTHTLEELGIVRRGVVTVTVGAVEGNGGANVALSPELPGAIADYLPFTSMGLVSGFAAGADVPMVSECYLTSVSNLWVSVRRGVASADAGQDSTTTVGTAQHGTHLGHTPLTHSSIDVNVINPHTHDSHTLTHAAHTNVHDHSHLWPLNPATFTYSTLVEITCPIRWLIMRA